jgi:hypothetical protein
MSREADIAGFTCGVLTIAPGATNAYLMQPTVYQVAQIVKYLNGGSLEIHGLAFGQTNWTSASLAALPGTGYLLSTTEAVPYDGAARYYLMATGATVQCCFIRGLAQSTPSI